MLPTRYWSRFVIAGCFGIAVTAGGRSAEGQGAGASAPEATRGNLGSVIKQARDRVFPALVNIKVITVNYWGGKEQKGAAVGSGTIISPQGHVLTNYHVVRNGRKFVCTLADKHEVTAELTGEDPLTDLAVLKLDASELADLEPLPVARFGDSDLLEVGDTVMAMGSPLALSRSVTLGIVSNTERILAGGDDDAGELYFGRDQRTGLFNRWIQHDASISPGNSGGPLVNLDGAVVGVNARGTFFGGDMGFAIPANVARRVSEELIAQGEVRRSWVGMSFKPIKKTGLSEGVLLNSVIEGGPADRAGLEAGDVVLEIDREPVTVWFPEEVPPLLKRLAEYPVGSSVSITYQRDGQRRTVELVMELLKKDRGDEVAFRAWVALALARERPNATITATDVSTAVLDVARANASEQGVENVSFVRSDWFDGLESAITMVSPSMRTGQTPNISAMSLSSRPTSSGSGGSASRSTTSRPACLPSPSSSCDSFRLPILIRIWPICPPSSRWVASASWTMPSCRKPMPLSTWPSSCLRCAISPCYAS